MKKTIPYVLILLVFTLLSGCSAQRAVDTYNGLSARLAGNNPPTFFKIDSVEEANNLKLTSKYFDVSMPIVKQDDFIKMGGWYGMNMYNGENISLGLNQHPVGSGKGVGSIHYDVEFSSSIYPYTERERSIENKINNFPLQRTKPNGETIDVNLHYETHGKEKYICLINESYNEKLGERKKHYGCYKFNSERTVVKKVSIDLTYTRVPNLSKELEPLANEYTYEDLQKRSQRILDSLYIKDGWEK
ncbi:hypothetical protein [Sulfuricurvum sp.]|uniref:hypothetical protein n=1 Tax=Sulfuricurvum sp. TaxID=2025608 RepID=UPI003BB01F9B